ncbi:unnamed protein product [Litomosoides sigmodontis]|uniref:Uncharacterized protein n=1 Tax=Litomosoides sigmodontis TaxID=42156 RepID=A0A3P6SDG1_LITSI|nr:unnamed protein product [Litomosoides sigmodontis]
MTLTTTGCVKGTSTQVKQARILADEDSIILLNLWKSAPEVKLPDDNEEDDDAIIIRVTKPTSTNSNTQSNNEETPLLDNQKSETKM